LVRRLGLLIVVLSLLAGVVPAARATSDDGLRPLHVESRRIVDDTGRTVLLRGVNVNQLGDYFQGNPAVPATLPFSRADLEQIAALGMNSVRLLVHWSRLEPQPGVRDDAYLAQIREAVTWAAELGIYVVLDMHQDAWGKYIATSPTTACRAPLSPNIGWDGAPEWATLTDGLKRCKLALREASPAAAQAWQSFWIDRPGPDGVGIQQHFVDTWRWLAAAFKDDPTVVGYDILNEPNPGWVLSVTEATSLGELHRRSLEAIRAGEVGGRTKIVFFEPLATWSAVSVGVPRPWTLDSQIVFAPHIYAGSITADRSITGREVITIRDGFAEAKREAKVYGAPFWVGEWGHFGGDAEYVRRFAALEDEFQVGSAIWQWKQACGDPHGVSWPSGATPSRSGHVVLVRCGDPDEPAGVVIGLDEGFARVLSRPYPRAFPGEATFVSDPLARTLRISGRGGQGSGPLEVWFPSATAPIVWAAGLSAPTVAPRDGGWLVEASPVAPVWSLSLR
jgi:endoglycosylceramidase